ncbi:metal-dependent hydrolase [Altererythrobacter aquiaggeris]|uniref:metal-dependent hydrolase n=1 Tax=Aestuarierythrobacter aquiaggeris TaxID=1898396 RepID=UPI00301819EF
MDNLTHSLVGALLGQAGLKRKTGLAMPALVIGANLPDVDAACFFWLEGVEHLGFRRGITHGPPAMVLLPLMLAGLLYGFDRWQTGRGKRPEGRLPVSFKWLFLLSFIGCLTHPAMDWLNVYGIRLLEPFSSQWFYGDTLFIIDVWLWALMGFATWFSLRREKKTGGDWRKPARIAIAASLAYIGVNGAITHASKVSFLKTTNFNEVIANPLPLTFWQREMVFDADGTVYMGMAQQDWSAFGGLSDETVYLLPQGPSCLGPEELRKYAPADKQLAAFLFWSRSPYVVPDRKGGRATIRDGRFASPMVGDRFSHSIKVPAGAENCGFD